MNFAFGRTLPTQSTGPLPIQLVPKHRFYRYLSIGCSKQKNKKMKSIYFLILLLGGPSPPSQLVPIPFNWSPNTFFTDIYSKKALFGHFVLWTPPPMHPPPPWVGGGRLGEFTVCTVCVEKQKTTKNGQMAAGRVKMSERVN